MGDGRDVEDGIVVDGRVESGVIPERAFGAGLSWVHEAFDDKVDIGRHLERNGLATNEIHWTLSDESGEQDFVESVRKRSGGGKGVGRITADCHCDWHGFASLIVPFAVASGHLVDLPMHAGFGGGEDLHAVHPEILITCVRIHGVDAGEGDEPSAIIGPALEDGQVEQGRQRTSLAGRFFGIDQVDDIFARSR